MERIYFDNNATTPPDPRVRDAMLPWLDHGGNPSSVHGEGREAREAVEAARDRVAALVGASPTEVIFCGSGTEANNAVIFSAAMRAGFRGRVVIASIEHPSIRAAADRLEALGMDVVRIDASLDARVDPDELLAAVDGETRLVCLMLANNEVGTLQPVAEVAAGCRERGVPVLSDVVQAVGKVPVDSDALGADYLTLGAHKFHGPLGAAALVVRGSAAFEPYLIGGSQEGRRRASTVNVPAVVGFGVAAELAEVELAERAGHLGGLRDRFESGLAAMDDVVVHGRAVERLPNTSHVAFLGVEGQALMIRLDLAGLAVSTGSACSSGAVEPSPTMKAIGMPRAEALSSLRVSFGMTNTEAEVDRALEWVTREVGALRALAATPA